MELWEPDFSETCFRAGRQEPQIGTDLEQGRGTCFQDSRDLYKYVGVLRSFDQILGPGKTDAGKFAEHLDNAKDV